MALKREQKELIVKDVSDAIASSKLTVVAQYKGTPVAAMQKLRREGRENGTSVKVIKNRLVLRAIESNDKLKNVDKSIFNGMLLYAFNPDDELAGAQTIANFAKSQPNLDIVAAFTNEGEYYNATDAKALASLPTKDQLRGQLVGLISSPLSGFVRVLSGNITGLVRVIDARANQLS